MSLLAACIMSLALCSCGGNSPGAQVLEGDLLLTVPNTEVKASAGQQFIKVTAFSDWSLEFDFLSAEPWASVDCNSGSGNKAGIILSWAAFDGEGEARSARITLKCKDKTSVVEFTQIASSESSGGGSSGGGSSSGGGATEIKSDKVPVWMELPATDREDLYFITHDMTLSNGKEMRNFSIYYDIDAKISSWVAYPLNKYIHGTKRSDAWDYDPKVPKKYQAKLKKGYKPDKNDTYYERGHQIPSADRPLWKPNAATFYFTNMTPQLGDFNGGAWLALEDKVRRWSESFDTLYVVTGADYKNYDMVAYDNDGQPVVVPKGYYKALLGYKKNANIGNSTSGYLGIAFYFEHRNYSSSVIMSSCAMTIDKLEEKLGIDFFVNLPNKVGEKTAAKIESTRDSWWK